MKRPPCQSNHETPQCRLVITTQNPQGGTRRRRVRLDPQSRHRRAPTPTRHLKRFIVSKGNRRPDLILRSRVSAVRSQVQVFGTRFSFRPAPVPAPDNPHLTSDCRDLRPENACPQHTIRFPYGAPLRRFAVPVSQHASLPAVPHATSVAPASQPFTMPADPQS
jgi:hypothetical protein